METIRHPIQTQAERENEKKSRKLGAYGHAGVHGQTGRQTKRKSESARRRDRYRPRGNDGEDKELFRGRETGTH